MQLQDIDVNLNFWVDSSGADPDIFSKKLREYQIMLYSRKSDNIILTPGGDMSYDYLYIDSPENMRLGSDCILNMNERYREYKNINAKHLENTSDHYKKLYKKYLDMAHTIGGEILFPKRKNSINVERGRNHLIKDRFDLTLECIRRYYNDKNAQNPLYTTICADKIFFDLFKTFDGYVEYFFLGDLVENGRINFFFGKYKDDVFNHSPLAWEQSDWEQLLDNQMKFLEKRATRIQDFCTGIHRNKKPFIA